MSKTVSIPIADCAVESVCVYSDRAEVSRRVEFAVDSGTTEIVLSGGSTNIERPSVRVSGGAGSVTILEVSTAVKVAAVAASATEAQVAELDEARKKIAASIEEIEVEKKWTREFMARAAAAVKEPPLSLPAATDQLKWFREQSARLQDALADAEKSAKKLDEQIAALKKASSEAAASSKNAIEISVAVHATKAEKGTIVVTYLIGNSSWSPSYDLRLISRDGTLQLTYYGAISNNSGEVWREARVLLSTALPAAGGEPPPLMTLHAKLNSPRQAPSLLSGRFGSSSSSSTVNPLFMSNRLDMNDMDTGLMPTTGAGGGAATSSSAARVLTTTVQRTNVNATFEIPRAATIESDGKPHKLTITIANLKATLSCTTIPALAAKAFLRARCTNSTGFPLLPGPTSVFMDNTFVTTSNLKQTNVEDELDVFLGVDPTVVVDVKPARETVSEAGVLKKTTTKEVAHRTLIRNTKSVAVDVAVFEQLPLAEDEKVKVKAIEPDFVRPVPEVILNEFNNVRWTLHLTPGQEQVIVFRYSVEWPRERTLDLV